MHSSVLFIHLIVVISILGDATDGATMKDVKDLHRNLMEDYNQDILPIFNQSAEFVVETGMQLLSLGELKAT